MEIEIMKFALTDEELEQAKRLLVEAVDNVSEVVHNKDFFKSPRALGIVGEQLDSMSKLCAHVGVTLLKKSLEEKLN